MTVLALLMTDAGLAAIQAASGTDPVTITEIGLTGTAFDYAPTLEVLPGEFKRVPVESGIAAAPNITHLTAYDTSEDLWTATGIGLYLDDGTLFGVCNAPDPLISKAGVAFALLVFDIAFQADLAASIAYGNAIFVYPPATEETPGVARISTTAEVDTGTDDATIVSPLKLAARLAALFAPVTAALATLALKAITITGGGIVSGGGDLSENRVLTVTECDAADITAGMEANKVVTPRRLGPIAVLLAQNGYVRFFGLQIVWGRFTAAANATTSATFALAFDTACFSVVASGVTAGGFDSADNPPAVVASTISVTGFSAFSADETADVTCYLAVGY